MSIFLAKIIKENVNFYLLTSSLFYLFHIIRLFLEESYSTFEICRIILNLMMMLLELLWLFFLKLPPTHSKINILLIFSLSVHFLSISSIHSKDLTLQNLLIYEASFLLFSAICSTENLKFKILIASGSFIFFSIMCDLFKSEFLYSFFQTLIMILSLAHLMVKHNNNVNNPKKGIKISQTKGRRPLLNALSSKTQSHFGLAKNLSDLTKKSLDSTFLNNANLPPVTSLLKKTYSHIILNSIREGIVVFDKNFQIKWHNKYMEKLISSDKLDEKLLGIQQEEAFLKLQNNFLRTHNHYTHLFKAFQTKIEPLKIQEFAEVDHKTLLSATIPRKKSINKKLQDLGESKTSEMEKKFKNKLYLNGNMNFQNCLTSGEIPRKLVIKTFKDFLKDIFDEIDLQRSNSEICSFTQKCTMYGVYRDEEENKNNKNFFIRFFPHKEEIVVMLKYMPENDLIISAMNDFASQNKLFASMCHELRTPLNYMTNILEIMHAESDFSQMEFLNNALMNSKLLISSVNDFLDYFSVSSNIFNSNIEEFNLHSLLEESFNLFNFLADKKDIAYEFEFDDDIPISLHNDEKRIRQIILNLLNNSFKYTEAGCIKLIARYKANINMVEISVQDTGTGIPNATLCNLGNISSDSSENHMTGGFGLCIANHLANYVGPNQSINTILSNNFYKGIKVRTELEKGSLFSFLVRSEEEEEKNSDSSNNEISFTLINAMSDFSNNAVLDYKFINSKHLKYNDADSEDLKICQCVKVLAVDDNEFNLSVLQNQFKKIFNCEIDIANSGVDAIKKISNYLNNESNETSFCNECKFYKLILMDIDMPVKNGYETTIELKKIFQIFDINTPIVALSAFSQLDSKLKAEQVGMDSYIEKPITKEKIQFINKKYLV